MESGKGFFVQKDGYELALTDELEEVAQSFAKSDVQIARMGHL